MSVGGSTRIELRREEARTRATLVSGVVYDVALDLTGGRDHFATTTIVDFRAVPGASTFLEFGGTLETVSLNGRPVPAACVHANRIELLGLEERNVVEVRGRGRYRRDATGLHRFVDSDGELYLHTKFAPYDAHRVYACFDQPDIKAQLRLSVTAPEHWRVVANTPPVPGSAGPEMGKARWRFHPTWPLPTYLTALVAGPFAAIERRHGDVALALYAPRSRIDDLRRHHDELFGITGAGLAWYAEQFACPYPFGPRYDQVFVPEYGFGAMEHPGCVTFSERFLFRGRASAEQHRRRAEVLLHEMAHMWFGNLVTMRWWDDLWLNEAFATLLAVLAQEQTTPIGSGAWQAWLHDGPPRAREADQLPTAHPVSGDVPDTGAARQQFDAITYKKGAAVLVQLVDQLGFARFVAGVRRFFDRHAWGNADRADFLAALAETGLADVSSWSAEWLERAGLGAVALGEGGRRLRLTRCQPGPGPGVECVRGAVPAGQSIEVASYEEHKGDGDGGGVALVELGRERVQVRADSTGAPLRWQPRRGGNRWLVVPNANGRAYVKAVLDATSMAVALERLGALADPVARAVCSGALWDAVADGTLEPTRFVAAVIRHLRSELVAGVVEQLVERAVKAATLLSADPCAGPAVTALAGAARNWLEAAEPGADLQLVSVRLLCTVARSPEDLDLLERLLSRPGFVRGLEVDTELRWQLLVALAAAGCIATEDISLAEARDGTEHARRQAWAARAALPDPAMKASSLAWIASTAGSLAERRAAMEGWQQPHQRALLAPFAVQYPETAVSVWSQGEEAGIAFARAMYPHHTPDDGVVLAATASLDHEGVPGGLRRVVQEERARLARYQLARRRDASCCEPITPG